MVERSAVSGSAASAADNDFEVVGDHHLVFWQRAYLYLKRLAKLKIFFWAAGRALAYNKERRTLINEQIEAELRNERTASSSGLHGTR